MGEEKRKKSMWVGGVGRFDVSAVARGPIEGNDCRGKKTKSDF